MKNVYPSTIRAIMFRIIALVLFTLFSCPLGAQQSPSIQTGVSFQWLDTQNTSTDPATIESVTINGTIYNTFVVPTSYELTRLGPDGHNPNRLIQNGTNVVTNSSDPNWDAFAISAFQDKNLNHYFFANPSGRDICLDFDATETTDAQKQTIFYSPAIPTNNGGVLAVTERGGNNCFYIELWGTPANGGPEQLLGSTFVRSSGNYSGSSFGAPNNGSDYWKAGRVNDNGQTIGIGLFYLSDLAPTNSKITKIEFVGASRDHGDGKFFLLQKYAVDQQSINCIDQNYSGSVDLTNNVPLNSTYNLVSGPSPAGQSFTFNPDGSYTYIPTAGFSGDVIFNYEVCLPAPNTSVCDTASVTLNFAELPPVPEGVISCNSGPDNFSITVTNPLGAEYEYALNGGAFQESPVFNNLPEGIYYLSMKSTYTTCLVGNDTPFILENIELSTTVTNGLCSGETGGSIAVDVSGGTAPFTYSIDAGTTNQSSGLFENLSDGNYNVVVTDANGCNASISAVIAVEPDESPTIAVPETLSFEGCDASNINATTSVFPLSEVQSGDVQSLFSTNPNYNASDDFGILSITYKDIVTSSNACPVTVLRTFTVTDSCNNTTTASQTITVSDSTAPILNTPADITIECGENESSTNTGIATATDTCGAVTIMQSDFIIDGDCGYTKTIERTWTATDACGNSSSEVQIIIIEDTRPPLLTVPADVTVECNEDTSSASTGLAKADDICGGVRISESDEIIPGCGNTKTIIRTWTTTDNCGNATSDTQTITVVDTTPPTISVPANISVECGEDVSSVNTGTATGTDNCGSVTISQSDLETAACGNTKTIIRTWTATDECGNASSADQMITVEDTTPPIIDDSTIENIEISCGITPDSVLENWLNTNAGATATDTCGDVTWSNDFDANANPSCLDGAIMVTFTATDSCGNAASISASYTIIDNDPPLLTLPNDVTIECGEDITPATTGEATATDACAIPTITYVDTEVEACGNTKTISRTWSATDGCGNSSSAVQTITVQDTTPPTFTVPADISIECNVDATDLSITGDVIDEADNCSGTIEAVYSDSLANGTCENSSVITRTWTLTDDCGNTSSDVQIITVQDTTPPTFSVPTDLIIECDEDATDLSLTGDVNDETDNCATNLDAIFTDSIVEGSCTNAATITRTWSLTDNCDNTTTFVQTITVVDTTPPTISVPANISVECGEDVSSVNTGTATGTDNCGSVTISQSDLETAACGNTKTIIRTWTATDECGNASSADQMITVEDTTPPIIDDSTIENIEISCGITPDSVLENWLNTNAGATATDTCGDVTWSNDFDANANPSCLDGAIMVTFTATDSCGNAASISASYTIIDNDPPLLTLPNDVTIECGEDITPATTGEATATDACAIPTITYVDTEVEACGNTKTISRTWSATDGCGNSSSAVQTITVQDTTPPTFTVPDDITIECDVDASDVSITGDVTDAADNCATDIEATFTDSVEEGSCPGAAVITRTWILTDGCGNNTSAIQTITVQDTTAPSFNENLPQDIIVECDNVPDAEILTVSDSCGSAEVEFTEETMTGACHGNYIIERTWITSDSCGNEAIHTQTVTVEDNTPPTMVSTLDDVTLTCDEDIPTVPSLVFQDSCSNNIDVSFSEVSTETNTREDYEIIRTWTVTDDCGNVSEFTQTIFIVYNNVISTSNGSLCILDSVFDLFDLLSGDFDMNGTWTVVSGDASLDGSLFNPATVELGDYIFKYAITEGQCPVEIEVTVTVNDDCVVLSCGEEDVVISKTVTVNGDGFNDTFTITGIEDCDFVIEVQIFNRWGAEVFQSNNYKGNWNGESHSSSVGSSGKVPTGTYYYIVNIKDSGLAPFTGPIYVATN